MTLASDEPPQHVAAMTDATAKLSAVDITELMEKSAKLLDMIAKGALQSMNNSPLINIANIADTAKAERTAEPPTKFLFIGKIVPPRLPWPFSQCHNHCYAPMLG